MSDQYFLKGYKRTQPVQHGYLTIEDAVAGGAWLMERNVCHPLQLIDIDGNVVMGYDELHKRIKTWRANHQ